MKEHARNGGGSAKLVGRSSVGGSRVWSHISSQVVSSPYHHSQPPHLHTCAVCPHRQAKVFTKGTRSTTGLCPRLHALRVSRTQLTFAILTNDVKLDTSHVDAIEELIRVRSSVSCGMWALTIALTLTRVRAREMHVQISAHAPRLHTHRVHTVP